MNSQRIFRALKTCSHCSTTYRMFTTNQSHKFLNHRIQFPPILSNTMAATTSTRSITTDSTVIAMTSQDSRIKKLFKKVIGIEKSYIRGQGFYLYECIADKLDYKDLIERLNLPNTFYSWFVLTELHVWMLAVKCMAHEDNGKKLRNACIESMWADLEARSKFLKDESNPSELRRQIKLLGEQFQAALISYDEGLLSADDRVLAGAVWRRIYQRECDTPQHIESVVKYIRQQIKQLDDMPFENFMDKKPEIEWIKLT